MLRVNLPATSLSVSIALVLAGCSDLPPGQPGAFADGAAAGGQLARGAMVTSAEAQATGSTAGTIAAATIVILAKHQATPQQKQIAVTRAKVAVARLRKAQGGAGKSKTAAKVPRFIVVDTVKDEHTTPQAAKAVVVFDTVTEEVVGNNVYDVKSTPPLGETARFDTFTAEYVGTGS
jgi:hypothetical protein